MSSVSSSFDHPQDQAHLPGTANVGHSRCPPNLLSCDTSDFISEQTQTLGHAVHDFLQLFDLSAYIDLDLPCQVASLTALVTSAIERT